MSKKYTFKTLEDKDIDFLTVIYNTETSHDEKIRILTEKYNVVGRTVRRWWRRLGLTDTSNRMPEQLKKAREKTLPDDVDVLLVTSAQNKTLVNEGMFRNMHAYRDFITNSLGLKAEIVVVPSRYRNPITSETIKKYKKHEWWAEELDNYLHYYKIEFANTTIAADLRIRPTAVNPLRGLEPLAGMGHLVIGHPRHQFKPLARFIGEPLKTMGTTGYVTRPNYTISKAGAKGEIHHNYGFTVIEKKSDTETMVPRKVKVNLDGEFTDIIWNVKDGEVNRIESSQGYVWGDIHRMQLDPKKHAVSMSLMEHTNPVSVVLHDLLDGYSFNPHESKNTFLKRRKIVEGKNDVLKEVDQAIDYLRIFVEEGYKTFVVQSNHDQFLDRYINDFNWKKDLHNSPAYLKFAQIQQTVDLREYGNLLGFLIDEEYGEDVEYVRYVEPLKILDYSNFHGEFGSNGSRGSLNTFRKLNTKIVHGHNHTPTMGDNVTSVGTSSYLWQDYNSRGPSSWAHGDNLFHNSGKNQLIVFDEEYLFTNLIPDA